MATFFHGNAPEIQQDGLQTLYLMNPGYVGYPSDSQSSSNMMLLNQQSAHQHQLLGIPLQQHQVSAASPAVDRNRPTSISLPHDISAVHGSLQRGHYNPWAPPTTNSNATAPMAQQGGLSLSLSPQQPSYGAYRPDRDEASNNGNPNLQGILIGSKYLNAAQQLLDEVVNVRKAVKDDSPKVPKNQTKVNRRHDEVTASELTAVERQELQMKKAKLAGMLDEVRLPRCKEIIQNRS